MSKTVSLVLGSGGARGYAHIGVIEALEQSGFEIHAVVGSSMGALIGGLYANRTLDEYKDWVLTLDLLDVLRLVDFTFSRAGMIKGDRVFEKMSYLLGEVNIEDLEIDYTAVATDIVRSREVWFQRGGLKLAIRASIAIPMLFTPVRIGQRVLVDGGLLNPLPVAPTVSHQTDLVIAVNINASQPESEPTQSALEQQHGFDNGIGRFLSAVGLKMKARDEVQLGRFEVMSRAFEIMQQTLSNYKLAGYRPDLRIDIASDACNFYDFHKAAEMIELGRNTALKALQEHTANLAAVDG